MPMHSTRTHLFGCSTPVRYIVFAISNLFSTPSAEGCTKKLWSHRVTLVVVRIAAISLDVMMSDTHYVSTMCRNCDRKLLPGDVMGERCLCTADKADMTTQES